MLYTQLLDPFTLHFQKDEWDYEAIVTYVQSVSSCGNFFFVKLVSPEGTEPFYLQEKPAPGSTGHEIVWMDENSKSTLLYQILGAEIEKHLRQDQGIFLIDAPVQDSDNDNDAARADGVDQ